MRLIYIAIVAINMFTVVANARQIHVPSKEYKSYETAIHNCPFEKHDEYGNGHYDEHGNVKADGKGRVDDVFFDVRDQTRIYAYVNYFNEHGPQIMRDVIYRINSLTGSCTKIITLPENTPYSTKFLRIDEKRKLIYTLVKKSGHNHEYEIAQYNFSGKFIRHFTNKVPSGEIYPDDIELDSLGNLYMLDKFRSLIHKFSSSGKHLLSWGGEGSFDGKLNEPTDMAIDKNNMVYVADAGNYRIQKFNSSGQFITKWGKRAVDEYSPEIDEFGELNSIAVDNNSHVYVEDAASGYGKVYVKKFYTNGDYIGTYRFKTQRFIGKLQIDNIGNMYRYIDRGLAKFNKNFHLLDGWGGDFGKGAHKGIRGMNFDRQNNMYTLDNSKCLVQKFSKNGKLLTQWGESGINSGQFNCMYGDMYDTFSMDINNLDEIYILDTIINSGQNRYTRIQRFNGSGKFLQNVSMPDGVSMAIDANNNVYVAQGRKVDVYSRYLKKIRTMDFSQNSWFDYYIMEIDIDKKRNVMYLTGSNRTIRCDLSGKVLDKWNKSGDIGTQTVFKNGAVGFISDRTFIKYSGSGIVLESTPLPTGNASKIVKEDNFGNIYIASGGFDTYRKSVNPDIDHDGVPNESDAFPFDKNEWLDTDHDGIGNNADKDDDNDGIPDSVEIANGLNPLNASDASGDLDKDGFSNLMEYELGTNIRSASSKPIWTPVIMGEIITFIATKP